MLSKCFHTRKNSSGIPSQDTDNSHTIIKDNEKRELDIRSNSLINLGPCFGYLHKIFGKSKSISIKIEHEEKTLALLGPQPAHLKGRKTLVLDIDETLVHSAYEYTRNPDIVLPMRNKGMTQMVHIKKRPGVDKFLARVSELFEVVIFTASIEEYARPLMAKLDKGKKISSMLFRESCTISNGNFAKDLSKLGRDLKKVILIDNCAKSFELQPENAYHIKDFFDDNSDNELEKLLPFLEYLAQKTDDVRPISVNHEKFAKRLNNKAEVNQEQSSPKDKIILEKKPSVPKSERNETEKEPLNLDIASDTNCSIRNEQEEQEAIRVLRDLAMRRTLMRKQLKSLDKSSMLVRLNSISGSASTASTIDKERSACMQTPEFKISKFDPIDSQRESQDFKKKNVQKHTEKNSRMLSRMLELAGNKTPKYQKFDIQDDEYKISPTPRDTARKLLDNEETVSIE